jgi:GT2 family glycosyltransferase
MLISVCIAAWRSTTLRAAIVSIQQQTWTDWELLIVGQGADTSIRTLVDELSRHDSRITYVHSDDVGTSRARNTGMGAAHGDIVVIVDDDCEGTPAWLSTIVECFEKYPDIGLVGGAVLPRKVRRFVMCPGCLPSEALYDPVAASRTPPRGWDWMGCNVAIRREIIENAGPFDSWLGPGTRFPSAEDTDYKLRLERLGVKMYSTPRALVHHTHGVRYSPSSRLRLNRNYAWGSGGLAGKLTLLHDPRGEEWLEATKQMCRDYAVRRPPLLPSKLRYLRNFTQAYRQCLRDYSIDPHHQVLVPQVSQYGIEGTA